MPLDHIYGWTRITMDVFSSFPPELVGEILVYLPSEELVNCLQVSSSWRHVVSSFRRLWVQQCLNYGLPRYYLQGKTSKDLVSLFLSTRRQRHYIAACKHKVYPNIRDIVGVNDERGSLARSGAGVHSRQVVYAGKGIFVVVMFSPRECQGPDPSTLETGDSSFSAFSSISASFTPYNALKQLYQFEYILIERLSANSGKIEGVCRVALEDKWKWPVITQAIAANDQSWVVVRIKESWIETAWYKIILQPKRMVEQACFGPSLQLPDFSSVHHRSNPYDISCCRTCSAVALVKNKLSMRPPWECSIDILHISNGPLEQQVKEYTIPIYNYDPMRLSSDVHTNVVFCPTFFCQQPSNDSCASHKLILWRTNDHTITVHNYNEEEGVLSQPVTTFSPVPQGKTVELSTAWGHARMKFSADYQLMSFLMARYLHLWSLITYEKLQTVYLDCIPGLRSLMLAVGHVYSLFGTLHEGGEMVLVSTQTGKAVWRCESFSQIKQGQFDGIVQEDWMSDVQKFLPTNIPLVLYTSLPQLDVTPLSGLAFTI